MARTVNEEKYAEKRNEILNAVQRLVMVKGYEQMTIQDILKELEISSGAFYHYFDSKTAILDAFIERIREETEKPLLPILHDPQLSALEKLRGFFDVLDRIRSENRDDIIQLARVWYTDENAIVRQKVDEAMMQQRGPLLTEVVRQGFAEGVFQTNYPEMSGEVILSLMQGMGNAHARIFFSEDTAQGDQARIEAIVAVYDAYMDAIERTLGAPAGSLRRLDIEAVQKWVTATSKG
ncbi:MAG: TetR/AcrR family transcriptional regulator [Ardenticatenaceae bacterium]|nr:TetR/AcrR family transcriptional regulator [Ardenticatenaceae bacterium]